MGVSEVDTLEDLKAYVDRMVLAENHDPDKFMKKKKALPVARITEETFEMFLETDLVFVNFFAPWYLYNCINFLHINYFTLCFLVGV